MDRRCKTSNIKIKHGCSKTKQPAHTPIRHATRGNVPPERCGIYKALLIRTQILFPLDSATDITVRDGQTKIGPAPADRCAVASKLANRT